MTTNREWLYSLDVADLADWFDAEHVETEERALDGDTEPENEDSRERLEADIRELMRSLYEIGYTDAKLNYGILGKETRPRLFTFDEKRGAKFIELLDRQAVITERETTKRHELFCETCEAESDKRIAELRAELEKATNNLNSANEDFEDARAELTAERDELQEQLRIGWECECRLQAERERYREKFGKCLDYADAIHALMDEGMA